MVNLKNRKQLLILALLINVYTGYAQSSIKTNITIVIDNELVTSGIKLNLITDDNKILVSENYHIGKELNIDENWYDRKIFLTFTYIGKSGGVYNNYKYKIDLSKGYVSNTRFLIVRIFNLDKPKYKNIFCKSKGDYVVEIQNQSYTQQEIQCEKFEKF